MNARTQESAAGTRLGSNSLRPVILATCLLALPLRKVDAEDKADFKFSYYLEDHHRTEAFSPALLIETDLTPNTILTIQSVYDVISGATPTGEPMKRNTREVTQQVSSGVVPAGQVAQTSYVAVSGASGSSTETVVPAPTTLSMRSQPS